MTASFLLAGISCAALVEPKLPPKHEVKRPPRDVEPIPPAVLTNPELPKRTGMKAVEAMPNFRIHSAGRVAEQFDSNVFLADTETKTDFITILAPSVGFEMKLGETMLSADYEIVQHLYGTWHSQNHLDQRVRAMGERQFTDYKITVNDEYRLFTDRAANENSLRLKEDTNDFKAGVSAQFDKFGFDAGYMNKLRTYDSSNLSIGLVTWDQRAFMDQSAYLTLSYRYWPKTYIIFENDIGNIRYYETSELPDSWYVDSLVGLRGEWTNKITINLRAGFRYQHYESSDSVIISTKSYGGPIVRGGLEYNPTKDDKLALTLGLADYESIYATNNYYTSYLASLKYQHNFNEKWSGGGFATYQYNRYPCESTENGTTAQRYDNMPSLGVNIRYDMNQCFSAEAKYEYRQKVSNFDTYDYKDNLVTLRGTVGF